MSLSRASAHRAKASPSEQIWGKIPDTHVLRCSLRSEKSEAMTSGCAVTSEAGLGPVTIWAGGQPQVRQEGVTLAQRLQLLTLTQRGPCAVLGAQRGLG